MLKCDNVETFFIFRLERIQWNRLDAMELSLPLCEIRAQQFGSLTSRSSLLDFFSLSRPT